MDPTTASLLSEQLRAVQHVMELNVALSRQLAPDVPPPSSMISDTPERYGAAVLSPLLGKRLLREALSDVDPLKEPLLSKPGAKPSGMKDKQEATSKTIQRRTANVFAATRAEKHAPKNFKEKSQVTTVEDKYNDTGIWQSIARSNNFQNATLIVIIVNTLWLGVDTDHNKADVLCNAPIIFQIADNLFCFYFTFEILSRFLAFRRKLDCLSDFWFLTDSLLVLMMIWETWIQVLIYLTSHDDSAGAGMRSASVLRLFRAFRLLRISRMTRLLRSLPELFILVKSIGAAVRCMFVTLCMLIIIIYIFAIMFTQLLSGTPVAESHFDSVPEAMNFMLLQVLCGFDTDFVARLLDQGFIYYLLWLTYVLIGSLSIMNVLIGILCEVVSGTAGLEKESAIRKDLEHVIVTETPELQSRMEQQVDSSYSLTKGVMESILHNPRVTEKIEELGVDVPALLDFVHFFNPEEERHLASFVEMVVQFRGSKTATVKDIVDVRKFFTMEAQILEQSLQGMRNHS